MKWQAMGVSPVGFIKLSGGCFAVQLNVEVASLWIRLPADNSGML